MPENSATTVHAIAEQGEHIVGIADLRVILAQEGNHWFAQGLEVDYVAQGPWIEDAKENFETGLASTLYENLQIHGTIQPLLVPAPVEVWKERFDPGSSAKRYTHVSVHRIRNLERLESVLPHRLPFQVIEYLKAVP